MRGRRPAAGGRMSPSNVGETETSIGAVRLLKLIQQRPVRNTCQAMILPSMSMREKGTAGGAAFPKIITARAASGELTYLEGRS